MKNKWVIPAGLTLGLLVGVLAQWSSATTTSIGRVLLFDVGNSGTVENTISLNSANNIVGTVFRVPRDANATITRFDITLKNGSGGTTRARLVALDANGLPDCNTVYATGTAAGGTAATSQTITFGTPYAVTAGQYYAVVLDNTDGTPGTNYLTVAQSQTGVVSHSLPHNVSSTNAGSSWTNSAGVPAISIGFHDGTYMSGALVGTVSSALVTFKQNTTGADEYALAFTPAVQMTCTGVELFITLDATTSDFNVLLLEDANTLETLAIDATNINASGAARLFSLAWPASHELLTTHTYRISIQPSQTAGTVSMFRTVFGDVADRNLVYGAACHLSKRLDANATWTDANSAGDFEVLQGVWPVVTAITYSSGTYTDPNNVRYNVDRGDGTLGTCHVPDPNYVLAHDPNDPNTVILTDATYGKCLLPAVANVVYGTKYGPATDPNDPNTAGLTGTKQSVAGPIHHGGPQ